MCIIVVKKAGIPLPNKQTLKTCWNNNSDGAGYMLARRKSVTIRKGFMDFDSFYNSLRSVKNSEDLPIVLHFRITTHGGTFPQNTHPFPVTDSVEEIRKLKCRTTLGIAHNGIIKIGGNSKISDTMNFVIEELSLFNQICPNWYKDELSLKFIKQRIDSKLAILDRFGHIATVGQFYEEDGILYSNYSYMEYSNYGSYWNSNYYQQPKKSDNSVYYLPTKSETEIIRRLEIIGMLKWEIEEVLDNLDLSEIETCLKRPDALEVLYCSIYGE